MFKRVSGSPKIQYMPKQASTVFTNGGLVYKNPANTGYIIPADATSGDHFGVILRAVTATDADYATAGVMVPIDVCTAEDLFEVDIPNGDLALTDVGSTCDLMADGAGIDPDAVAKNVVTIVGFVSASKAIVKVNAMAAHKDVVTT